MKVCVLGSGSRGNSVFIASSDTKLLVDAGLTAKAMADRLRLIGEDPRSIGGILLSHEHADHQQGARLLAQRYGTPVYATAGTIRVSPGLDSSLDLREFEANSPFHVNGLQAVPFSVCHDALDPVGFVIGDGQWKVGVVMDLGTVTRLAVEQLKGCHVLVLEFNHDLEMLLSGPYPWELKQRVKGPQGHLNNEQSAQLLSEVASREMRSVVLAHLSEVNNRPARALLKAEEALKRAGQPGVRTSFAHQSRVGEVITLKRWG